MKKISLTLVVVLTFSLFLSTTCVLPVSGTENSWTPLEPMPTARSGLSVAAVNGKIYAIGGSTASGFAPGVSGSAVLGNSDIDKIVGTNEEYDPEFSDNEDSTEHSFNGDEVKLEVLKILLLAGITSTVVAIIATIVCIIREKRQDSHNLNSDRVES